MTRLRHQLHMIRLGRGTAVVLLILVCLVAALGASAAGAQSPEDETAPAELCPGLQPLTTIVNLRTLHDGGPLSKTTTAAGVDCSVTITVSEVDDAGDLPADLSDAICTVTARPRSTAAGVETEFNLAGTCGRVMIGEFTRLPVRPARPAADGAVGASSGSGRYGEAYAQILLGRVRLFQQWLNILFIYRDTGLDGIESFEAWSRLLGGSWWVLSGSSRETTGLSGRGHRASVTWTGRLDPAIDPSQNLLTAYARTWVFANRLGLMRCDNRLRLNGDLSSWGVLPTTMCDINPARARQ